MRALISLAAGAAVLGLAGGAAAEPLVKIKDAVARVVIIPEARSDVQVEFLTRNPRLPLKVRQSGGRTIIDGDLRFNQVQGCRTTQGTTRVKVRRLGEIAWDDIPQIAIRVPAQVSVAGSGAVFGSIGRSDSVSLANAGCGDWTVANTKGELEISQAGSGGSKAGSAASADINIAGSGDISIQQVNDLEVSIAGSGGVRVAAVRDDLKVNVAGSGGVTVAGGRTNDLSVSILGSGDVVHRGEVERVSLSVAGSGDVRVAKVTGPVSKSVAGSGNIHIGQ